MGRLQRQSGFPAAMLGVLALALLTTGVGFLSHPARSAPGPASFQKGVLPIFGQHCVACHSPGGVGYTAINLDLRSYRGLRGGSSLGVAVIPYHPELSPLIAVLEGNGHAFKSLRMPPLGPPLSAAEIGTVSRWIQEGAKDN